MHMINDGNSFLILCFNLTYQDIICFSCYVSVQQQVSVLNILFQTLKAIFSNWVFFIMARMITQKNNCVVILIFGADVHYCEMHKLY